MLKTIARSIFQSMYRLYAVTSRVRVARSVHIGPGTRLWAPNGLSVEADVYIGKRCTIEVDGTIGRGTLIANDVGIVGRRDHDLHEIGTRVAQSTWVGDANGNYLATSVTIGEDVWLGYGAVVLAPITIGRGAVIAAGAVVVHDVEPYSIVAGSPARAIGSRFSPEQQVQHESRLGFSDR